MEHVSSKHCQYHTLEVLENYIRVVVKGEEMLGVDLNGVDQKVLDISSTGRGCDPLGHSACWQIAVVVASGSPTRSDLESSISVTLNSGDQWPMFVLRVHEDWSSIVTNTVDDAVVYECLESITVVHTSDRTVAFVSFSITE